jgi:hypothetical protein
MLSPICFEKAYIVLIEDQQMEESGFAWDLENVSVSTKLAEAIRVGKITEPGMFLLRIVMVCDPDVPGDYEEVLEITNLDSFEKIL